MLSLGLLLGCATPAPEPDPLPEAEAAPPAAEVSPAEAPAPTCPEASGLCLVVQPEDTLVVVDGDEHGMVSSIGEAGARFIPLSPGIHRITLRREGMQTWRTEVTVAQRAEPIVVELEEMAEP
ncbi:MAG: hypothetical protein P1V51_11085 [Deltaproteobacteria bacterium]|nr:hypothetical protein [Deltaproteobacteria bacterium]